MLLALCPRYARSVNGLLTFDAGTAMHRQCIVQYVSRLLTFDTLFIGWRCVVFPLSCRGLDVVKRWTGTFFDKSSLAECGHQIHMGHTIGVCPSAGDAVRMRVYDVSGVHTILVVFCDCIGAPARDLQLLHVGWYPSTALRPRTAFTFDTLSTFHELNLQGKTTVHDWYHTMLRKTDGAGLGPNVYREKELARVVRQWQNVMSLKRGGRAHDPSGIGGTARGALAVECPACPQPGWNLPSNWMDAPPAMK